MLQKQNIPINKFELQLWKPTHCNCSKDTFAEKQECIFNTVSKISTTSISETAAGHDNECPIEQFNCLSFLFCFVNYTAMVTANKTRMLNLY